MCTIAPILLPGLAVAGATPVSSAVRVTMAAKVEGAPAALRADVKALLRGLDAAMRPPTPDGLTPLPVAAAMERDPAERPSADYFSDTQAGEMTKADRAELIESMHGFSRYFDLAPGSLHRAVSYVYRFLSARNIDGGDRQLYTLGAAAVFAAAKYEERSTLDEIGADDAAELAGSSRREVLDAERELLAALGYRLSGPTAHPFVDHFTRHNQEEDDDEEEEDEGEVVSIRSLAHHLANMALLDYRCVALLPSAVAAAAIALATRALDCSTPPCLAVPPVAGYTLEDLSEGLDAIYDMHEYMLAWPGCVRMMSDWWEATRYSYSLPPRSKLTDLQ